MIEFLNIVDENDVIVGQEERKKIHELGLLHREIHVYFITPNKEIIFQHRAKDKDTFPDLLDATVGGHVEIGDSYEQTAVKETFEETGMKINPDDLIFISKIKKRGTDKINNKINYSISAKYLYIYKEPLTNLKIETGMALGFEVFSLVKLKNLSNSEKTKFIPYHLEFATNDLANFIKNLK
jgi:isopentenyldiphosphate isomerase